MGKFLTYAFIILLTIISIQLDHDVRLKAFDMFVKDSKEFLSVLEACKKSTFVISDNPMSFEGQSVFVKRELQEVDQRENKKLNLTKFNKKIGGKRKGYAKVYFTTVKEGMFICEVFSDHDYKLRPRGEYYIQGTSYLFLFRVTKEENIELLSVNGFENN